MMIWVKNEGIAVCRNIASFCALGVKIFIFHGFFLLFFFKSPLCCKFKLKNKKYVIVLCHCFTEKMQILTNQSHSKLIYKT